MLDHNLIRNTPDKIRKMLIGRGEFTPSQELVKEFIKSQNIDAEIPEATEIFKKSPTGRVLAIEKAELVKVEKVDLFFQYDVRRKEIIQEVEVKKADRNNATKEIGMKKKNGEDAIEIINAMKIISNEIKNLDQEFKEIMDSYNNLLLEIPNCPDEDTSIGVTEDDNKVIKTVGEIPVFSFDVDDHVTLGENLDILDLKRGAKVSGARFVFMKNAGARLERALISFMLDNATLKNGREELLPPMLALSHSFVGTGQLPKFEEDMYYCKDTDLYLISTAEVPVTNYHREEILNSEELPKRYAAFSVCFRKEAGSWGRDMRGIIRQHQFNKVELVTFCKPEDSEKEHEIILNQAEELLQALKLPYRVVRHCTGELTFSASKCYDLEVYLPSQEKYREISSCSNFRDFQARRASIRYKENDSSKPEFVHTLNGSALALGRTIVAILENYQTEDGSVIIPEVLRPYMGGLEKLEKNN